MNVVKMPSNPERRGNTPAGSLRGLLHGRPVAGPDLRSLGDTQRQIICPGRGGAAPELNTPAKTDTRIPPGNRRRGTAGDLGTISDQTVRPGTGDRRPAPHGKNTGGAAEGRKIIRCGKRSMRTENRRPTPWPALFRQALVKSNFCPISGGHDLPLYNSPTFTESSRRVSSLSATGFTSWMPKGIMKPEKCHGKIMREEPGR